MNASVQDLVESMTVSQNKFIELDEDVFVGKLKELKNQSVFGVEADSMNDIIGDKDTLVELATVNISPDVDLAALIQDILYKIDTNGSSIKLQNLVSAIANMRSVLTETDELDFI